MFKKSIKFSIKHPILSLIIVVMFFTLNGPALIFGAFKIALAVLFIVLLWKILNGPSKFFNFSSRK